MHTKWNHKIALLIVIMILSAAAVFTGRISRVEAGTREEPLVVLYDQNNNPGTQSSSSQEFPDVPTFTANVADDFVVPAGQSWNINEVDATGVYFNGPGPADNFNITFYQNSGTLPGTLIATRTAQPYTNTSGLFAISLATPVTLPAGTYWVSVQAHMTFDPNGQWGWTDRTVQSSSPAAFQNPGGGFAVCPTWGIRQICLMSPAGEPDQLFRLQGSLGATTPTPGITPTPTLTPTPSPTPCNGNYIVSQIGGTIAAGTVDTGNHGDDTVTTIVLPFPVTLYGTTFTSINLSSNGNGQFVTNDTQFSNACLPWTTHDNTVYPYWDDLRTDAQSGCSAFASGCGIFTSVSGVAPNRIFNIEWRAVYFDDSSLTANFELRLYEGQSRFDVVYGTVANGNSTATAGVQKNDSLFAQYFCDGTGGAATGGQSYVQQGCGTPTPAATPTPTRTPTPTPAISPTPTPVASPSCSPAAWQSGPAQPPARYAIQGAVGTDGKLYVAGGQTGDTTPILYNQVSRFDPATNTWSNVASLPVAASQTATAATNGKVYVAGGSLDGVSIVTNALRIYDIASNTWTSGANMPNAGLEAAAAAIVNGKLYVMGGDDGANGLNTTLIYDIATNAWTSGAALPDFRTNTYGTAASNGMIYVYGGVILPAFTTVDNVLRYDPVANSWTNLGSAGTGGRGNYGGISPFGTGQLLITDGALSTGVSSTSTHIFTIATNTFSAGPALIGNRAGHAQGTLPDGRVLVADGFNTATTVTSTVELLGTSCPAASPTPTPAATPTPTRTPTPTPVISPTPTPVASPSCAPAAWTAGPAQAPARALFQGALGSDNKFYIAGGQDLTGAATFTQVSRYNATTNAWESVAALPVGTGQDTVAAANGKVYVAGGFILPAAVVNTLRIYDIATNTWTTGANMPAAKEAAAGAIVNGKFYVMGGDDGTNGVNTNYVYDIASNTWTTGAPLPDSRTNTVATAVGGQVYVFGGGLISGTTTTAVDTLLRYDPVANTWANLGTAGTGGLGNYGGVSPSGTGQLTITAGSTGAFVPGNVTRIYTIATNTFSPGPPTLSNRSGHPQGTLADGRVIIADGFDTSTTMLSTVELLAGGACPSPTPTPPLQTPTPPRTPTPTPTVNPTPTVTPTPVLRFCSTAPIDMTLNQPAAPYPSTITVAGAPSITGGVIVTLNALWHQLPDNIDVLLVGPQGQKFVLMADAGGPIAIPQANPVTLILRDFQPTVLPNNGPLVSGTFMPTNWETPVLSFAPPAPAAPYVEPGNQPFPPIGRTLFGSFGLTNPNGVWSLYVRDDGGNPFEPDVLIGSISGGWCLEFLPPTAAGVSISGRVMTASGAGIRNARVVVSGNALPESRVVTTGSFGYFSVDGLIAGETYVVTVNSQRYTFQAPSRVYNLVDNITDADFVADQQ